MSRIGEFQPADIPPVEENVYEINGYKDRADYLKCLSEDTGVDLHTVQMLADLLGPNEDFDGLVTSLEDYAGE